MEPGKYHTLTLTDLLPQGAYLEDEDGSRILLPRKQIPAGVETGDAITVFVYLDSEDRLIATSQRPKGALGEVAWLEAIDINQTGAFLDWGLAKDLFVPFAEQKQRMEQGKHYAVYITQDNTGRLIGSARLNRFIKDEVKAGWPGTATGYDTGDSVKLLIVQRTDIGYKAVVDNKYWGVLYNDDIRKPVRPGQRMQGYVKRLREDNRLDLMLEPAGHGKADPLAKRILKKLEEGNGTLGLNDYSPADLIELHFGVSKRTFKMAIGKLFKERKIVIEEDGIRLATEDDKKAPRQKKAALQETPQDAEKKSTDTKSNNKKDGDKKTGGKKVYRNPKKKSGKTLGLKKKD
ncbi:MAG: GntR family transcriptional regulator [Oceanospirillaceae bacterium]|nr:GntR family transcriptional regulator [Oceanospirillaceae bacterium]MBT14241.1 GntR family transcriptional regulator [Oceanospirillaceae bacterium]|tara:strand:- start:16604 stop:17644 length:1041 start_codon:yes stop_codon:yes gene_type:complete